MSFLNFPPSPLRIIFQDLPLAGCGKLQVKSQLSTEDGATEQQVGGTVCVPVSVTGSETLSSEGVSRHPNSPRDPTRCSAGEKSTCRNAAGQLTGLSLQVPLSHLDVGHCKKNDAFTCLAVARARRRGLTAVPATTPLPARGRSCPLWDFTGCASPPHRRGSWVHAHPRRNTEEKPQGCESDRNH